MSKTREFFDWLAYSVIGVPIFCVMELYDAVKESGGMVAYQWRERPWRKP